MPVNHASVGSPDVSPWSIASPDPTCVTVAVPSAFGTIVVRPSVSNSRALPFARFVSRVVCVPVRS